MKKALTLPRIVATSVVSLLLFSLLFSPLGLANGPKSVYGTLYVAGQKAATGIDVKIKVDNQTFSKKTLPWNVYNYIIGIPPGYEGKTAYFLCGKNNVVPTDNASFVIGSAIEYVFDLHVGNLTQNAPPTAVIDSVSPNPAAYNWTVHFDGHGSDPNGNITAYQWRSSISGDLSTNRSFDLTNMAKGNHTIYFKVKDNNNSWSSEVSTVLRITHYNRVPVAIIDTITPKRARVNTKISFTGHGSDVDGTVVGYAWRSNRSGDLSSKASFNTSGLSLGNHTIYLKVQDNSSYWSSEVHTWVLVLANVPPTARISGPTDGHVGVSVQFDGTGSTDPDGTIASYLWEFGDGTNSIVAAPTHTFGEAKSYTVKLTVTDDSGAKANVTTQISIIVPTGGTGEVHIGKAKKLKEASDGTKYQLTLSATNPDGGDVFFSIQWGDGKKTTTNFTGSDTPITIEHVYAKPGSYKINVTTLNMNYDMSGVQTYDVVISDRSSIPILYLLILVIIVVVGVVLGIFLLKRRRTGAQPAPYLPVMNDEPQKNYLDYAEQPLDTAAASIPQPGERSSGFKRI